MRRAFKLQLDGQVPVDFEADAKRLDAVARLVDVSLGFGAGATSILHSATEFVTYIVPPNGSSAMRIVTPRPFDGRGSTMPRRPVHWSTQQCVDFGNARVDEFFDANPGFPRPGQKTSAPRGKRAGNRPPRPAGKTREPGEPKRLQPSNEDD